MKVLLVEDDLSISELLSTTLTVHRYTVDVAHDGQTGLELARLWDYDVILLDVQLPKLDGITVCRQLRSQGYTTPILILTAKDSNNDIVTGLDAGADDYVTKPCDPSQLLARIRALLRRGGVSAPSPLLTWGDLCLDPALVQVTYKKKILSLRPQEYSLLELFLRHPQRVFSRSVILDHLWTAEDFPTENAVTNLIKDLRRKLKSAGMAEDMIETIYGLGYRLKTLTPEVTGESEAPPTLTVDQAEGLALIHQLSERFRSSLDERVALLEETVRSLPSNNFDPSRRQEAEQEAHRLAGALGTYGYDHGSQLARLIEMGLTGEAPIDGAKVAQLLGWLRELQQEVTELPAAEKLVEPPVTSSLPLVLVVDQDAAFAEALWREAPAWGLRVEIVSARWATPARFQNETPAIILIDLEGSTTDDQGLAVLQAFKEQFPAVPVLTLAEQDSLTNRIAASRLGSERYLLKPLTTGQVLEAIAQFCLSSPATEARVLAVDDDRFMLLKLTKLLQPWGLQVTGLTESERFWEVLTQIEPDLLILDLEMPPFNGIELCRIVRQDAKYGDLPILVVTAHTELEYIQQVFEAGADDLIHKPIAGPELVTRVTSRIERSRLRQQLEQLRLQQTHSLQQQSRVDSLTQIANRRQFDEFLEREWQCHIYNQAPLSLILCDVDFFKLYNDHYGHLAGDSCLKQIASAIQTCVKPLKDLVARYGGEEFGVILPNTSLNGALQVAEYIRQAITNLQISHNGSPIDSFVTISMGIAGAIPAPGKPLENLIRAADEALYTAKRRGRNTYCLYPM